MWTLSEISAAEADSFQVAFRTPEGTREVILCSVFENAGVESVRPEPDVFMEGHVPSREVSAAVIAFHHARIASNADGKAK
jgi:hypothetical protein